MGMGVGYVVGWDQENRYLRAPRPETACEAGALMGLAHLHIYKPTPYIHASNNANWNELYLGKSPPGAGLLRIRKGTLDTCIWTPVLFGKTTLASPPSLPFYILSTPPLPLRRISNQTFWWASFKRVVRE